MSQGNGGSRPRAALDPLAAVAAGQTYHGSANLPLLNALVGDTLSYLGWI